MNIPLDKLFGGARSHWLRLLVVALAGGGVGYDRGLITADMIPEIAGGLATLAALFAPGKTPKAPASPPSP